MPYGQGGYQPTGPRLDPTQIVTPGQPASGAEAPTTARARWDAWQADLARRIQVVALDPHKYNVLVIGVPHDEVTEAGADTVAQYLRARLELAGVRAVLVLPDTWRVDFAQQEGEASADGD